MKQQQRIATAVLSVTLLSWFCWATASAAAPPPLIDTCDLGDGVVPIPDADLVTVETPFGDLVIETYSNVAPQTVANFLGYIERGDYADSLIHRAIPGFVIQTGGFRFDGTVYESVRRGPSIPNEPCLQNVEGTLAMAKVPDQPDSATSEWFVNLSDNNTSPDPDFNLDTQNGGFTVFARVLGESLDVADDIAALTDKPPADILPSYYAGVRFQNWTLFQGSPLMQPVVEGAYGCFDPDQSGALLVENPVSSNDYEPNPALDLDYTLVSWACTGGAGAGGPEVGTCDDRRVVELDPATGETYEGNGEFGLAEEVVTCDALDESLASYGARIDDITSQLAAGFVTTTYFVPEPGASIAGLTACATLAALRRRRR